MFYKVTGTNRSHLQKTKSAVKSVIGQKIYAKIHKVMYQYNKSVCLESVQQVTNCPPEDVETRSFI